MSQPLAGNHSPPPAASAPNLVFKDKRAVENISKQLVYDHEFHSGLRNSQAGQTPQATGEVGYPDVFPHPMFTTPRNPPPLPDKELTLAHNAAAPGVPLRPSSKAEAAGTHTTVLGPSSFAHPVRVLGLVGNGLCLHGCRGRGPRGPRWGVEGMQRTERRETGSQTCSLRFPGAQTSSRAACARGRRHVEDGEEPGRITWAEEATEQAQPPGNPVVPRRSDVGACVFFFSFQGRFLRKMCIFIIKENMPVGIVS